MPGFVIADVRDALVRGVGKAERCEGESCAENGNSPTDSVG